VAEKSEQFTADETRKGQFLRENRRNLAGEGVVRKISSPDRVAIVPNLCIGRKGSVAQVLASGSASSFPESPA